MGKLNILILWIAMLCVFILRTFLNTPFDWIIFMVLLTGTAKIMPDDKLLALWKHIKWVYLR